MEAALRGLPSEVPILLGGGEERRRERVDGEIFLGEEDHEEDHEEEDLRASLEL